MKINKSVKFAIAFVFLIWCASVANAEGCNQGQQNRVENQGRDIVLQDPSATSNTGVQAASDPNEIVGMEGYDAPESTDTLRWVSATQSLAYTVYFENDAELAMASTSKVTITVPLQEKHNFATFKEDKQL